MEYLYQKNYENLKIIRDRRRRILSDKLKKQSLNELKYYQLQKKYQELINYQNNYL